MYGLLFNYLSVTLRVLFSFFYSYFAIMDGGGDESFTIASPDYILSLNFEFGFFVTPFYIIHIWGLNFK